MDLDSFTEQLLRFDTTDGNEAAAQAWLRDRLDEFGFDTYEWTASAARLAEHPSFPDGLEQDEVADRPSVGGVLEFGDPEAGSTLVMNGHFDVVPAEPDQWENDPFEPTWDADRERLTARGAVDMKTGLAVCVAAALDVRDTVEAGECALDGRLVVEAVAGEEDGGVGAAAAALDNPYPFDRDAAVIAEPTDLTPVIAVEGSLMARLHLTGRSSHAATSWVGESVLPHFERIRRAFEELEAERCEGIRHPLYEDYPIAWPVVVGRVEAGSWASSVPASLTAELRIGVAPGETVADVEAAFRDRLAAVVEDDDWLRTHPPRFERFSVQFEAAEIDSDEPIVGALQSAMTATGLAETTARGETYGADSRHYIEAGIPTVLFGPGTIDQAHYPDETIEWADVEAARRTLSETARTYLSK
ncbi:M20/M25/M40 family metallo-hydrolase [Haloferacaceae archaeon DSL9]